MNDGGNAFPIPSVLHEGGPDSYWSQHPSPGMSLRDYFAGQALASIGHTWMSEGSPPSGVALDCYKLADAMLTAREGSKQ